MEIIADSVVDAHRFFDELKLTTKRITGYFKEIRSRLTFMMDVGLDYLTLDRESGIGGEAQRIRLATQIGAGLAGWFSLDEPVSGLSARQRSTDQDLQELRDLGNTVLVVEHDEQTIRCADYVLIWVPKQDVKAER